LDAASRDDVLSTERAKTQRPPLHVKNGRRIQLANWSGKVTSGDWHELRAEFQRDHVAVCWDGTKRIDAHDRSFTSRGRVGVWTKADSYRLFHDLTANPRGA